MLRAGREFVTLPEFLHRSATTDRRILAIVIHLFAGLSLSLFIRFRVHGIPLLRWALDNVLIETAYLREPAAANGPDERRIRVRSIRVDGPRLAGHQPTAHPAQWHDAKRRAIHVSK